jgi:hypothetical protein
MGRTNIEHHYRAKATSTKTMTVMVLPLGKNTKPGETKEAIYYFLVKPVLYLNIAT